MSNAPEFEPILAAPKQIIGPDQPHDELTEFPIREFRYADEKSERARWFNAAIDNYFSKNAIRVNLAVHQDMETSNNYTSSFGPWLHDVLRKKLISPKAITGTISELSIAQVTPEDLPSAMVSKFTAWDTRPRVQETSLTELSTYYKLFGKFRAGSTLSTVACGVCVTPILVDAPNLPLPWLTKRVQAQKFSAGSLAAEDLAWNELIQESKLREAEAMNHPLSGGLVNPR